MSVIHVGALGKITSIDGSVVETPGPEKILKIGVIGYGYWGPQLVRNFQDLPLTTVSVVADLDPRRLDRVSRTFPSVSVTRDFRDLFDSEIDAVVIATSPSTHYPLGAECLAHGKHVLIEKPLARSRAEAEGLIELAEARGLTLMVGHTFEYNPAVETLKQLIASQAIGRVYYTNAVRTNLGIFQKDVNVLWDLAPHDISILMYILDLDPIDVSACGQAYVQRGIHDVARLVVNFENQVQSHILVSWLDPCKVRRITVVGDKKMVVYDDVEALEKIKVYDTGVDTPEHVDSYGEFQLSYRYGDITIPRVPAQEPLKVECSHFADCILGGHRPRSDGTVGLKVVKVLEAAEKSLRNGGGREPVAW
ncbi:MAG TPA: Gfo/Idh/MocA family oxidoreductase [Chloroflexota bacterium]|nr:Gfo/Idh/MocA family oxidoreductase [Chloroflexota bacterium]